MVSLKFWKRSSSAINARKYFQRNLDFWEGRELLGDVFLDEWMTDTYDAMRQGLAVLDKLEESGIDTGKNKVVSKLKRVPNSIIIRSHLKTVGIYEHYDISIATIWDYGKSISHQSGEFLTPHVVSEESNSSSIKSTKELEEQAESTPLASFNAVLATVVEEQRNAYPGVDVKVMKTVYS